MAFNVFLSHCHADVGWVDYIIKEIEYDGFGVYRYDRDPQAGALVADKITRAIDAADVVVVFLTESSARSTYVQQEIGYSRARKKRVIPLTDRNGLDAGLAMLDGTEYVPFDYENPENALDTLIANLRSLQIGARNKFWLGLGIAAGVLLLSSANGQDEAEL